MRAPGVTQLVQRLPRQWPLRAGRPRRKHFPPAPGEGEVLSCLLCRFSGSLERKGQSNHGSPKCPLWFSPPLSQKPDSRLIWRYNWPLVCPAGHRGDPDSVQAPQSALCLERSPGLHPPHCLSSGFTVLHPVFWGLTSPTELGPHGLLDHACQNQSFKRHPLENCFLCPGSLWEANGTNMPSFLP